MIVGGDLETGATFWLRYYLTAAKVIPYRVRNPRPLRLATLGCGTNGAMVMYWCINGCLCKCILCNNVVLLLH